jgi:hypothetical protein
MASSGGLRENWVRPFFFYGNNRISLIGGALTSAAAFTMIGFWVVDFFGHGGSSNPYLGLIFDVFLPGLFVLGLVIIPLGILWKRSRLKAAGQVPSIYPEVDLRDPSFRHGIDYVVVATFINFVIVGTASYRAVAYMDTPNFCGQPCHVMAPEWAAYHVAPVHEGVACTECHIAPGVPGFVHAKANGTKQLMMVVFHDYPTPIMADDKVPAAAVTCLNCHNQNRFIGDKLLVETTYASDEKNSMTRDVTLLHVGGRDRFGKLSGIHGAHLGHIEYIATDSAHQTIPWVGKTNDDGSITEFVSSDAKATGQRRVMDCIDCHNRAAHSFDTAEAALDKDMAAGSPSASLPFVHKQGLALIQATYSSPQNAQSKIVSGLESFYRSQYPAVWNGQRPQIDQAAQTLATIYRNNIFPFMKVTWGTHPNNLGHNDYPGCFRCHDGSHNAKSGASITNDCSVCHNLIATDDPNPKQLTALGIQ